MNHYPVEYLGRDIDISRLPKSAGPHPAPGGLISAPPLRSTSARSLHHERTEKVLTVVGVSMCGTALLPTVDRVARLGAEVEMVLVGAGDKASPCDSNVEAGPSHEGARRGPVRGYRGAVVATVRLTEELAVCAVKMEWLEITLSILTRPLGCGRAACRANTARVHLPHRAVVSLAGPCRRDLRPRGGVFRPADGPHRVRRGVRTQAARQFVTGCS